MNIPVTLFRVDGSNQIGLGHVYRCIALAQMINQDFNIQFYSREIPQYLAKIIVEEFSYELINLNEESELLTDLENQSCQTIVVLDGYQFNTEYQLSLKKAGAKVVCIDDMHQGHFVADVVINHAPNIHSSKYSKENYTSLFLGPDYALLRSDYLDLTRKNHSCKQLTTAFVCFGGVDPHNLTETTIRVLTQEKSITKIIVVTGAGYNYTGNIESIRTKFRRTIEHHHNIGDDKMKDLMSRSDFAIVPSSTILFEVIAARLPTITGYYVENQIEIYEGFSITEGAVVGVGRLVEKSIAQGVAELTVDKAQMLQSRQEKVIDGRSPKRVRRIFNNLL